MPFGFSRERKTASSDDDHGIGPFSTERSQSSDDFEGGVKPFSSSRQEVSADDSGHVHVGRSYEDRVADAHGHLTNDEIDAIIAGREVSAGAAEEYLRCEECQRAVSRREKFPPNSSWE